MKNYILYTFLGLSTIFLFNSCEDAIDLDLGTPNVQIVIDAVINQTTDTQWIYISKSNAYLNQGQASGYKIDSVVGIVDTATRVFHEFKYLGDGKYFFVPPAANTFTSGQTYQFLMIDKNNTYVSQSKLNTPTTIDSLVFKFEPNGSFGGGKGNYLTLWAKDKPGVGDYYWIKLFRNDSFQSRASDIRIAADNSFSPGGDGDGDLFIVPIRSNLTSRPYLDTERARVEVHTITPEMFAYLNLIVTQLQNVGLFAVPPANVPTNIFCINNPNNKVVGFFCMTGKVDSGTVFVK